MERSCIFPYPVLPSVILLLLFLISSCGGGSSSGNDLETESQCTDNSSETGFCRTQEPALLEDSPCQEFIPEITIDFPLQDTLIPTDSVTVIGSINEAECVSSIEISGTEASIDSQTNTWHVEIPLSLGINTISANVVGMVNEKKWETNESLTVDYQGEVLVNISAISNDVKEGQILVVAEDINGKCNIYRLNKVTGLADVLSEEAYQAANLCFDNGSFFDNELAVTRDGNRAFTMSTDGHLVEIDLQTGIRSTIANDIGRARLTGFNPESEVYYILQEDSDSTYFLYGVNVNTGKIYQVTNIDNSYPSYDFPKQLEVHAASNRIFIADSNKSEIITIDADAGESSVYTYLTKENGLINEMTLDEINDHLYVVKTNNGSEGITNYYYRLDLTDQTIELVNSVTRKYGESGPIYGAYQDAFYDQNSDCFYSLSVSYGKHKINCTNLNNSNISMVPEPVIGAGVDIYRSGLYFFDRSILKNYVFDAQIGKLVEIDILSGQRTFLFTPSESSDVVLASPHDPQLNNSTNEVIMMSHPGRSISPRIGVDELIGMNILTGERRVISSKNVGLGPEFDAIVGIALNSNGQDLYLVSNINGFNGIMKVDLHSGDRSIIYSHSDPGSLHAISFDDKHNRLLFCDRSGPATFEGKIFSLDIETTQVSVFVDSVDCHELTTDSNNNRLFQSMPWGWLRIRNLDTGEIESSIFHPIINLYSAIQSENRNIIYSYSKEISALVASHTLSGEVIILSR